MRVLVCLPVQENKFFLVIVKQVINTKVDLPSNYSTLSSTHRLPLRKIKIIRTYKTRSISINLNIIIVIQGILLRLKFMSSLYEKHKVF